MEPKIITPFSPAMLKGIQEHVREIRRGFDWPGIAYHDANEPEQTRMNRWYWHDLPLLKSIHNSPEFRSLADEIFGERLKPSYVFLSMYGPDGVVPLHSDRPQCYRTIDLQVNADGEWPIYVEDKPYVLKDGEALCYSGTDQPHYRKPMHEDSIHRATGGRTKFMNLAFFHFVSVDWQGSLS